MEKNISPENPYVLDKDELGMVELTEKNVRFIDSILSLDSNYRKAELGLPGSAQELFGKYGITTDYDRVLEQVNALDKENSTHLSASGRTKGDNQGRELTAQCISEISGLKDRLNNNDTDLVKEIASAVSGKNNFSFASKFCTYACRFAYNSENKDGYGIYDDVISDVLPYYAKRYLNERYFKTKCSSIDDMFRKRLDYAGYMSLIDRIISRMEEETGYRINHKDFDHILWYCYKGDKKYRQEIVITAINNL